MCFNDVLQELSLEKEDIPRTTADFQEALCQLQKADERLVKAQQDRDRAAELLTRVGVEQSAVLQRYPQVLNVSSSRRKEAFPESCFLLFFYRIRKSSLGKLSTHY